MSTINAVAVCKEDTRHAGREDGHAYSIRSRGRDNGAKTCVSRAILPVLRACACVGGMGVSSGRGAYPQSTNRSSICCCRPAPLAVCLLSCHSDFPVFPRIFFAQPSATHLQEKD
jgi:hypothetical protein